MTVIEAAQKRCLEAKTLANDYATKALELRSLERKVYSAIERNNFVEIVKYTEELMKEIKK